MIDHAMIDMDSGRKIALERISGSNDNMSKSHYHTYFEIYFLEDGKRSHMLDNHCYVTLPGDFMIFPPYTMHHSFTDGPDSFRRIVLYFTPDSILDPYLLAHLSNFSGLHKVSQALSTTIQLLLDNLLQVQENLETNSSHFNILLNALLICICQNSLPIETPKKLDQIGQVIDYIDKHYMQTISLDQLSQQFFMSKYHLCRCFKKSTNQTLIHYINTVRILHAQHQITQGDETFTKIASDNGFSSLTHFNRTFKSIVGTTPSQFKKTLRQQRSKELLHHDIDTGNNYWRTYT